MKTIVVGTDPGALCSALALDRDGHQVLVVGSHGGPQSGYERTDLSVLNRAGLLGDTNVPDAFSHRVEHRRIRFCGQQPFPGFSFDQEESNPVLFRRDDLREWLLRELQSTDVALRSNQEATGLLRPDRTVRGITTQTDQVVGDVVYLSENGFGWLTRSEEYGSSLPGEDPPHLVNLQASLPILTDEGRPEHFDELLQSRTVTTLLRSVADGKDRASPLVQVFPVRDHLIVDLYLTRQAFRDRGTSPTTLMNRVLASAPLVDLPTAGEPTLNLRLHPLGGWSRRATLCDHGLALGGAGAGLIDLWPDFDTVGPSLRSGYQFARTVTHLDRQGKFPGRDRLRTFYERPLSEGPVGHGMRRDEPLADRFHDEGSLALTGKMVFDELEFPGPSFVRMIVNQIGIPDRSLLKRLLQGNQWWELPEILRDEVLPRFNPFFGDMSPQFRGTDQLSRLSSLILRLTGWVWERTLRPSEASAKVLPYLLDALDLDSDTTFTASSSLSPNYDYRRPEQLESISRPQIHATVQNSLGADTAAFRTIAEQCPADVFDLKSRDRDHPVFDWNAGDCVQCGLCRFGPPGIDFYGSDPVPDSVEPLPSRFRTSVRDLFNSRGTDDEELRDCFRTVRRRLEVILDSLREESFLTPESRNWIDGQLNLARADLDEVAESDTGGKFVDYVQSEMKWIRRLLSRKQDRFAYEKLRTLRRFYRERTTEGSELPSTSAESDQSVTPDTDPAKVPSNREIRRSVRTLYESLRVRMRDRLPSSKDVQGNWSVGFLRPDRRDQITTVTEGTPDRILLNTEFGPRIFRPTSSPTTVHSPFEGGPGVQRYSRDNLRPVESDGFVPDNFPVTVEPFLVDLFDFYRGLIVHTGPKSGPGDVVPKDLEFSHRQALAYQLELLKTEESRASDPARLPVVYRLLAGTDAVFGALEKPGSEWPSDTDESSNSILSLLRALLGSPGDLIRQRKGIGDISEELVKRLSLSEAEQKRWERADTSGMIHDSVRQWRTTLGVLRGLLRNEEGTPLQRTLFLVRTWTTRSAIGTLQEQLDRGKPSRFPVLSLKLFMKRLFRARQPFEDPEQAETRQLGMSTDSTPSSLPSVDVMNKLISESLAHINSMNTEGFFSDVLSYVESVLADVDADRVPNGPLGRELSLLLLEFRDVHVPELTEVTTAGTGPDELLVLGPLLRWLDRFCSRMDELVSENELEVPTDSFRDGYRLYRELRNRYRKGIRGGSLRDRVCSLTEAYRENCPVDESSIYEQRTGETVRRSLELFEIEVSRRPNLLGLWSEYVRLIGRLQKAERTLRHAEMEEKLGKQLRGRLNQDLQNCSKLFNHGARELGNDREPPASQILDLFAPATIFPRRYTRDI